MINRSRPIVCVLMTVKVHGNVVNAKYIVRMIALKFSLQNLFKSSVNILFFILNIYEILRCYIFSMRML